MRNLLGEGTVFGYCTNVHAGTDWEQTQTNLERYSLLVKEQVSPEEEMGLGLWLSARTSRYLVEGNGVAGLRRWLEKKGFLAYTLNGFPYGDFHRNKVKYRVYRPDWSERDRFDYTLSLASILAELIPEGEQGSISTLPIAWGKHADDPDFPEFIAAILLNLVENLERLESETGRLIHIDFEPEPGCFLDTCGDVVDFFGYHLFGKARDDAVRRYLRVCHDICHSAVMFEEESEVWERYESAGIRIGKVQISSALCIDFATLGREEAVTALEQLKGFQEDRYLHQTVIRNPDGTRVFYEDLPEAVSDRSEEPVPNGEWRVHFHVPIYVERSGRLGTTQARISESLQLSRKREAVKHYEVETYAWNVLPTRLRKGDLSEGIAKEMLWLRNTLTR